MIHNENFIEIRIINKNSNSLMKLMNLMKINTNDIIKEVLRLSIGMIQLIKPTNKFNLILHI